MVDKLQLVEVRIVVLVVVAIVVVVGKYFDSDKHKNKKLVGKKKIFFHTLRDPGKYDYFCRVHQEETGSIIVHK
jgi:plastocyanin